MAKTKVCCDSAMDRRIKIKATIGCIAAIWSINHNQDSITDPTEVQKKKTKLSDEEYSKLCKANYYAYKESFQSDWEKYLKHITEESEEIQDERNTKTNSIISSKPPSPNLIATNPNEDSENSTSIPFPIPLTSNFFFPPIKSSFLHPHRDITDQKSIQHPNSITYKVNLENYNSTITNPSKDNSEEEESGTFEELLELRSRQEAEEKMLYSDHKDFAEKSQTDQVEVAKALLNNHSEVLDDLFAQYD